MQGYQHALQVDGKCMHTVKGRHMQSIKCKYDVNHNAVIMLVLAKYSPGTNCISVFHGFYLYMAPVLSTTSICISVDLLDLRV